MICIGGEGAGEREWVTMVAAKATEAVAVVSKRRL